MVQQCPKGYDAQGKPLWGVFPASISIMLHLLFLFVLLRKSPPPPPNKKYLNRLHDVSLEVPLTSVEVPMKDDRDNLVTKPRGIHMRISSNFQKRKFKTSLS